MRLPRLLLVVLASSLFVPVSCTLTLFPAVPLLAALQAQDLSKGGPVPSHFYVAVRPGCNGEAFRLEPFAALATCGARRSECPETTEPLPCDLNLPAAFGQLRHDPYETQAYRVVKQEAAARVIETVSANDDYTFTSRYRLTDQGVTPLYAHVLGPALAFQSLPIGLALACALRWVARRRLARLTADEAESRA